MATTAMTNSEQLRERLLALEIGEEDACPVVRKLGDLDEETAKVLVRMVEARTPSVTRIYQALKSSGVVVGRNSLSDHRERRCVCFSE